MPEYYFAFGSNMDEQQMKNRKAEFAERQNGVMANWKLVFNKINRKKEGSGYANIVPEYGSIVEGIIYKVSEDAIRILDDWEGVPIAYHKKTMLVENSNKKSVDCIIYIANHSKTDNSLKPERKYLDHLLEGKEFLSENYFSDLKNTETFKILK